MLCLQTAQKLPSLCGSKRRALRCHHGAKSAPSTQTKSNTQATGSKQQMNVLIEHTITAVCLQSFSATKWSEKSISATLKKQIKLSPRLVYLLFFKSHFQTFKLLLNIFKVISLLLCTSIHIFKVCACVSRVKRGSNE